MMNDWKKLTDNARKTFREEGLLQLGRKAKAYMGKQQKKKKPEDFQRYRDVLFINGCDEHLPHPGRYRVTHQREQLAANGVTSDEVYFMDLELRQVRQYGVFLFFRCPWTETIDTFVKLACQYKKTVLYDIDDLVFDTKYTDTIPYVKTMNPADKRAYDENVRNMGRLLDMCQGAVTSTECLADALKEHVPQVFLNRNRASDEMLALSRRACREKTVQGDKVRLGYFSGSITHNPDMELLMPVLVRLLQKYDKTELVIAGELDVPECLAEYRDRIEVHPFLDWRELPKLIASVDINLAPLADNIFNEAKSENKWMEAALVEVVTAASDLGAFARCIDHGVTGFLCKTQEDWQSCLSKLIEDSSLRTEVGRRAKEYCEKHYLTLHSGRDLARFIRTGRSRKAAVLLPGLNISGGIMVALWHSVFLREAGYDVTLIADNTAEERCSFEGQEFPVLPMKPALMEGYFDKMIATMWVTFDYMRTCADVGKKYYLVQNYETDFYEPGSMYRTLANATYAKGQDVRYITISRWCQRWLKEEFGIEAGYAPNGLKTELFQKKKRRSNGKIRILIEGDCGAEHKNVDESFKIVQKLNPQKYEIWYLSYESEPKSWYKVDRFFHKIPFEQVAKVYQSCHILLKTSVLESFSYPPLEMMATGGMAVVMPNGGNQEYLVNEENCLLYKPGDLEEAAACIERLTEDKELADRLIAGGLETAGQRDWKTVKKEVLELYE